LCGDCVEVAEGRLPYAPIVAALRPLAQELGPEGLELLAGPASSELAPLLPELAVAGGVSGAGIHPDVPALAQARLFEVLLLVLRRLGEQEPVLLVLEDIHWADGATRDFL
jgi:predicted ATPase